MAMGRAESASEQFVEAARGERDLLAARLAEARERLEHFEALAAEVREELRLFADSIRSIEERPGVPASRGQTLLSRR